MNTILLILTAALLSALGKLSAVNAQNATTPTCLHLCCQATVPISSKLLCHIPSATMPCAGVPCCNGTSFRSAASICDSTVDLCNKAPASKLNMLSTNGSANITYYQCLYFNDTVPTQSPSTLPTSMPSVVPTSPMPTSMPTLSPSMGPTSLMPTQQPSTTNAMSVSAASTACQINTTWANITCGQVWTVPCADIGNDTVCSMVSIDSTIDNSSYSNMMCQNIWNLPCHVEWNITCPLPMACNSLLNFDAVVPNKSLVLPCGANAHIISSPDGITAECVCDDGWISHAGGRCNYQQKTKLEAFLLSFFVGGLGVDWFVLSAGNGAYVAAGVFKLLLGFLPCCVVPCALMGNCSLSLQGGCAIFGIIIMLGGSLWWVIDWIRILCDAFPDGNGIPLKPW